MLINSVTLRCRCLRGFVHPTDITKLNAVPLGTSKEKLELISDSSTVYLLKFKLNFITISKLFISIIISGKKQKSKEFYLYLDDQAALSLQVLQMH